ncbi:MAG: hypothetical protein EOO71_34355 [Myxococcaceae bacterium]|nr:MAG: hypothetical protein EOO71_34355 [Myxococcaceae bacterium]
MTRRRERRSTGKRVFPNASAAPHRRPPLGVARRRGAGGTARGGGDARARGARAGFVRGGAGAGA